MNISELLKGIDACECGASHKCPIDSVVIGKNACECLSELTENYNNILLVADRNTYAVGGETVTNKLGDKLANTFVYDTVEVLVPDEVAIEALRAHVSDNTDLIIGIGSGVINDLCKHVSFLCGLPYFIVATSPSMDGYASKGAALILGGMKVTLNADVPKAIIGDVDMLASAPLEMIQAGYGDIIGKYSCLNDWKFSHLINNEYLCKTVMDATYRAVEETVKLAEGLKQRSSEAVGTLMEALVAVGILMAYVGNSRPASGSEHHMSHYFEIVGIVNNEPYLPHGIDVCCSAIETAKLRERLLALDSIDDAKAHFDREEYEKNIRRIYTDISDEVLALQYKLGWYDVDRVSVYREKWGEIRKLLADCPTSAELLALTEQIGISYDAFKKLYGEAKIADAHLYAKDLKDRYSVLWMYYDLLH